MRRLRELEPPVTSLYVHIPFCPVKCEYCAFVTHVGSLRLMEPYLKALTREAEELAHTWPGGPLDTIYFGGGTPSMVPPDKLEDLIAEIRQLFGLSRGCEITLEAHPETVDFEGLGAFRRAGVTRLSVGGESLNATELRRLRRRHTGERVVEVLQEARSAGFENVNIDLMYGIPGQTLASWNDTLDRLLTAGPDHLSLYPLSIEPRTVFWRKQKQHALPLPDDDDVAAMYRLACRRLAETGYEHYEVANWARAGRRCRHNLAYWYNREFYAVGVGAHGYLRPHRTENVRQTRRYIDRVLAGESPVEESNFIDAQTEFSETLMLRLRLLQDGLDPSEMERRFGIDIWFWFGREISELTEAGLIDATIDRIALREDAVPVGNEVWQRFVATSAAAA